jgi:hypothetical protein
MEPGGREAPGSFFLQAFEHDDAFAPPQTHPNAAKLNHA